MLLTNITTYSILICVPMKRTQNARVAQWWSIALPRRGSRVRIPSRAFFVSKNNIDCFLLMRYTFAKGVNLFT